MTRPLRKATKHAPKRAAKPASTREAKAVTWDDAKPIPPRGAPRRDESIRATPPSGPGPEVLCTQSRAIIIDKPAGLPVHASRAGGLSVESYFSTWSRSKNGPWLAHRLDQDTAGCLVIALKKSFLLEAQAAFAAGLVQKTYWAVVKGVPEAASGVIDKPLAKKTQGNNWKMAPDRNAPPAVTAWRVLGHNGAAALVEFSPQTGRTHQVRAHAAAFGHPIIGDAVYGGGAGRLMLLARHILLPLAEPLEATAPVPEHMRALVGACGGAI